MFNCKQTMIIYVKYIQLKRDNRTESRKTSDESIIIIIIIICYKLSLCMVVGICETIPPKVLIIRKINHQSMEESLLEIERFYNISSIQKWATKAIKIVYKYPGISLSMSN